MCSSGGLARRARRGCVAAAIPGFQTFFVGERDDNERFIFRFSRPRIALSRDVDACGYWYGDIEQYYDMYEAIDIGL